MQIASQASYAGWLAEYDWQWFATLTFSAAIHPEAARKRFQVWINWINTRIYGKRWYRRGDGVFWVLALEFQKRGVIHFHALLCDVESLNERLSRRDARNRWYQLAGVARVDPIVKGLSVVTNYVSKYVTKDGDLELSPSMRRYRSQLSTGARSTT